MTDSSLCPRGIGQEGKIRLHVRKNYNNEETNLSKNRLPREVVAF